jgi:hypothetical protein
MEQSNPSLVNANGNSARQSSSKNRAFKTKQASLNKPKDKCPEILWHHDLKKGTRFKYNVVIASEYGLRAALILEFIRYWCEYNVKKTNDHSAYSIYKTGHDLSRIFGLSETTIWKVIKVLMTTGLIALKKDNNNYGKINYYTLTKKYFDVAGLKTISRIEREIFYPNKEDVATEKKEECHTIFETQIDTPKDDFDMQISPSKIAPISPQKNDHLVKYLSKLSEEPLTTKMMLFSNVLKELKEITSTLIYRCLKYTPLAPIENLSEKIDFEETSLGVCETKINQEEMLTPEAQEPIKISLPKKRMPNERKTPLKAERKVRSAQRIENLEQFEQFHGFPSSLCRDKHEEFFKVYPKKVDQEASARAFIKLLFSTEIVFDDLMKRVKIFAQSEKVKKCLEIEEGRFIKNPANWLWDKVWKDIHPEEPKKDFESKKQEDDQKIQALIDPQPPEVQPFLQEFTQSLSRNEFLAWFDRASWKMEQDKIVLNVPSLFVCQTIAQKFNVYLDKAMQHTSVNLLEIRAHNAQGHLLRIETIKHFLQEKGE